jgi:nucleotide-binding universal stress UspA family protein
MYRRILVPLDGTRFGDHALPCAIDLARRTGAAIELLHVHHHAELDAGLSALPQYQFQHIAEADLQHDEQVLRRERRQLEERAADLELRYGIQVRTRIVMGRTDDAILREAQEIVADLVVMATHARSGLERVRHGSVAHELVTHLNVPALLIRPERDDIPLFTPTLRRVLVPLDGSEFSEQLLDVVAPLLQQLGAQPTLLHVVTPRPLLASGLGDSGRTIANRDQALAYLHEVAERFHGRMPEPLLTALEQPEAAGVIAHLVAAGEFDAVAMATHGRSGLSRLLLGSVAETVLRSVDRPVLLYRPRSVRLPGLNPLEPFRVYGG